MFDFRKFRTGLLVLAFVLSTGCSQSGQDDVPGVLVSTEWLQAHMDDPDLVILHSGSAELYDSIHIPGARLIDPYSFTISIEGVRNELPEADSIVELLRSVGVDNDSRIVLYHDTDRLLTRTARVYLTLDYLGLGEQTHVLNGGLPFWQEEERKLSNLVPEINPGKLSAEGQKKLVIESTDLDQQRWSDEWVLIDVRSEEEYYGKSEAEDDAPDGGHVEGAYFLPYQDLLMNDSLYLFKPENEMEELFRSVGMDPEKTMIVYCGSGIRACASFLAARHLGYPVLLYDGSYEEWSELGLPLTGPVSLPDKND